MTDVDRIAKAERLVRWGSSDERIEAVTALPLAEILSLRARAATPQRPRRDDDFPGLALWRARPAR